MIYAIDFDGVLCENAYPDIGEPNYLALAAVKRLRELGHTMILWTCRHDDELDAALEWLRKLGVKFDYVNENAPWLIDEFGDCRKIAADRYIDDKIPGWEWEDVLEEARRCFSDFCPSCDRDRELVVGERVEEYNVMDRYPISVDNSVAVCTVCGEEVMHERTDEENLRRAYEKCEEVYGVNVSALR